MDIIDMILVIMTSYAIHRTTGQYSVSKLAYGNYRIIKCTSVL